MTRLMALAAENGFSHWVEVSMTALVPRADVRDMCRADRCGKYGASWACPPGCGTLEQAAADMARCSSGLLVQTTGTLADDFDYEGMQAIAQRHKRSFESFARQARLLYPDCLPLTAGTCTLCARCTYPTSPAASRPGVCHLWRPTACGSATSAAVRDSNTTTERAP